MKLNVCTISFRHQLISFKQIALWAQHNQFQGIELWGVHAKNMSDRVECDRQWLSAHNLNVPMISDYLPLFGCESMATQKAELLGALCQTWGAKKLRTFAGGKGSAHVTKAERREWVARLRKLCDYFYSLGIYLVVETHPGTLADTLASTQQLLAEVDHPALRLNFDVIHVWEGGDDPIHALKQLEPYIVHVHLKNIADRSMLDVFKPGNVYAPAGDRKGMVNLLSGAYDFTQFLTALKSQTRLPWESLDASLEWFGPNVLRALEQDIKQIEGLGLDAVSPSYNPTHAALMVGSRFSFGKFVMALSTPYYLIDQQRMLPAMEKIRYVQERSGAKSVLALKCFSSWCVFEFMSQYMAGATSSSLYEAKLGYEKFGGENHGYSVAYDDDEIQEVVKVCDKVIFNSLSQWQRFKQYASDISVGLRINPEVGLSHYSLSDTVGRFSRLGVRVSQLPADIGNYIDGVMFHMNCENDSLQSLCEQLDCIEDRFAYWLPQLKWVSLGGGMAFTNNDFPLDDFCERLKKFAQRYSVQVYLEPGEAAVTNSTSLVVKVLDIVDNEIPTLIVDAGVEPHVLDALVYQFSPSLEGAQIIDEGEISSAVASGKHVYRVCGRTCLAGDVFGLYAFDNPVDFGHQLTFPNMAGYTMVKKNFFNGIKMPAVCYRDLEGKIHQAQASSYEDFRDFLS